MPHGLLIVEDEVTLARNLQRYLERRDYEVRVVHDGEAALAAFDEFAPDLVLLDLNLPDTTGLELLHALRRRDTGVRVIVMTGHGSTQIAVDAMKGGAQDYLSKPLVLSELKLLLDKALGQDRLEGTLSYYRGREARASGTDRLLGASRAMAELRMRIADLVEAERGLVDGEPPPVLITGETGTGKELVARALHFDGPRRERPFVEINAAAIPANLIESELFGHERGAFTDARERRIGLVEAAHGGTLFLDEIGDLDPALQVKLLKLLEDRIIRRLGSRRDQRVDVRIVTATNMALERLVKAGRFRADLFFRLRVVQLALPPLRARGEDVLELAQHFLALHGQRYGKPGLRLAAATRARLLAHSWPGNVRELRHVMEQAVLSVRGQLIEPEHVVLVAGDLAEDAPPTPAADATLENTERQLIERALSRAGGNVTGAARALGVSRDTLRYRIDKHGLRKDG